jgi:hypothetical protein
MNALLDFVRRIGAALLGTPAARPAPAKVKLATRNGYGNDEAGPPRS